MRSYIALVSINKKEVERIQGKLEGFLSEREARESAMQIFDLALDVDEEIDRIL